jgi:3D (Asp-Asp-Asp) domain-containing protein
MLFPAALIALLGCTDHVTTRSFCAVHDSPIESVHVAVPPPIAPAHVGKMMGISGYTSSKRETDQDPCIAAHSVNICELHEHGVQVCASNSFPHGTVIEVQGLGKCIVVDHMKHRYINHVDWYFGRGRDARKNAKAFGRHNRFVTQR